MTFTVLTIFPEMFSAILAGGIVKRAIEDEYVSVESINIRDFEIGRASCRERV